MKQHMNSLAKKGFTLALIFLLTAGGINAAQPAGALPPTYSWISLAAASTAEPETEASVLYTVGDKGPDVREIKKRLQALRYIHSGGITARYTEETAAAVRAFQERNKLPVHGNVDGPTWKILFSEEAIPVPYATLPPLSPSAPTPAPPEWPDLDAQGFLAEGEEFVHEDDEGGLWVYLSRDLQVKVHRQTDASIPLIWFETDIRTRGTETFHTVLTDPDRPGKNFQYPHVIATDAQFVLGFTDDFFADRMADRRTVGIIIRNGQILSRETNRTAGHYLPNLDMMAQYPDGRLEVYACSELTAEELLEKGAVNVFSFGPWLLRGGEINELVYTWYRDTEPRQALGMIEPGHYLLLSVQGRMKESKGTMLQRVAEMMKERGVQEALNLDGGNTMALVFRGRMLNKLATYKKKRFVRTVTSLIGIGRTAFDLR